MLKKYAIATVAIMGGGYAIMKATTNSASDIIKQMPEERQRQARTVVQRDAAGEMTREMIKDSLSKQ